MRFELARALPSLWSKAQRDSAAKGGMVLREKDKLRELLAWLLKKRDADVKFRQSIAYRQAGFDIKGRLDIVAQPRKGAPLAIELDWAYSSASLRKLQAANRQGMNVLWICGARTDRTAAKLLRGKANAEFGVTFGWLFIFHLTHGWL